jgi:hypothetical protein
MITNTFTTEDSGMFSGSTYNEGAETLTVTFRDGNRYAVRGVTPKLHEEWLAAKKSSFWHSTLKRMDHARVG